jgi:GNAT superfamily N-acetyltransferase
VSGDLVQVVGAGEAAAFAQALRQALRDFNDQESPAHRSIRPQGAIVPIALGLRDPAGGPAGGWAGGIYAEIYWGWIEIVTLFVPAPLRGRGTGSSLLRQAEQAARARGCTRSMLRTYTFQAPSFYERHGYRVTGRLDDYPPGQSFLWMVKDLERSPGGTAAGADPTGGAAPGTQPLS